MTEREALKLALEALEKINKLSVGENAICLPAEIDTAMDAIKEVLAQPEQEPVAWRWENRGEDKWLNKYQYLDNGAPDYPEECEPLYTTPPQRTWVSLTDEEILKILGIHLEMDDDIEDWRYEINEARTIEAKLKQKNT